MQAKFSDVWRPLRRMAFGCRRCSAGALVIAALAGCGDTAAPKAAVYPASGTITLKGQPMPGATIALHPKTPIDGVPNPRASVSKDGAFKLTTFNGGDGAPEGTYVVTVQWYKLVKRGPDVAAGPNVVPGKYASPRSSDLEVQIVAGTNELPAIRL